MHDTLLERLEELLQLYKDHFRKPGRETERMLERRVLTQMLADMQHLIARRDLPLTRIVDQSMLWWHRQHIRRQIDQLLDDVTTMKLEESDDAEG